MGYGGANDFRQIFTGAVEGTQNVLASVKKSGTVKRFVYTSSFAAVACPPTPAYPRREGYMYSEKDFASDGHENDPLWNFDSDGNVIEPAEEAWEAIGTYSGQHNVSYDPSIHHWFWVCFMTYVVLSNARSR